MGALNRIRKRKKRVYIYTYTYTKENENENASSLARSRRARDERKYLFPFQNQKPSEKPSFSSWHDDDIPGVKSTIACAELTVATPTAKFTAEDDTLPTTLFAPVSRKIRGISVVCPSSSR